MGDFRLGDWLVQPDQCRVSSGGRTVQVRAKVMDLLTYLAQRPGEVVSKERLLDDLWGSQSVSESALTRTVTELRQALSDNADPPPPGNDPKAWIPADWVRHAAAPDDVT